ncbi:cyclic nucleotide-binding protein [Xenococcus sp. PCC 7305]|uniref:cyclic nucleotide-binding domain-containing protein n=1 Tax=Xenococcus sp. PCC 7305 TaxID=102125 RepID=UPI0002ABEABF|nr:cyclic nucleotide-binding domain-containing protein [Xenococcus sp. PCC 7305]ELS04686.1 cyclic nucleotide-binding protein [Xenococcus sp. PCC 7305]
MLKPIETIKVLLTSSKIQSLRAGEIIFPQGSTGYVMYGIIEGEVEMLLDEKVIETIQQGDVFGQGALLHSDHLRTSTARAKIDCKIAVIDQEHFLFAVQETPLFALEVMRSYSDRFRRLKLSL